MAGGVYYLRGQTFPKPTPTPVVPQPTSSSDETDNWKTYTNSQYGYSIDYPNDWMVEQALYNYDEYEQSPPYGYILVSREENELQRIALAELSSRISAGFFEIIVFSNPQNLTLDQWGDRYNIPLLADPSTNLAKVAGATKLNGKDAIKISINTITVPSQTAIAALNNNYIYFIRFDNWKDLEKERIEVYNAEELIKIYDQILSTFRFIDSSSNKISINMLPQNDSGESGTAIFTDLGNGKTKIELKLENVPGGRQPAAIYIGSCSQQGKLKYPLTDVTNGLKTNLAPGGSESIINASIKELRASLPMAIFVQSRLLTTIDSCGNIQ